MEKEISGTLGDGRIERLLRKRFQWIKDAAGDFKYQEVRERSEVLQTGLQETRSSPNVQGGDRFKRLVLDVNLMTSQLELNTLQETDNEIIKHARDMSEIIYSMYLFTRGEGNLMSTEDFFKSAQELAESGRIFHKVARRFATEAEESSTQVDILCHVDRLPGHCQQLTFTSSSLIVGQAACYKKVEAVMHLTKKIITILARVINRYYLIVEKSYSTSSIQSFSSRPFDSLRTIDESLFSESSSISSFSELFARTSSAQNLPNIYVSEHVDSTDETNKTGSKSLLRTEL